MEADVPDPRADAIVELVTPLAERAGYDVDGVSVTPAGRRQVVRITVDADDGVTLDAVAELSREFSAALDVHDVMGDHPYTLEVGSRGATAPLVLPRHWRRNTGRLVKIAFTEPGRATLTGRIGSVTDSSAQVTPEDTDAPVDVAFADVARATVQVEFGKPARPKPSGSQRRLAGGSDTDSGKSRHRRDRPGRGDEDEGE